MRWSSGVDSFIEILCKEIPDRSSPGYTELLLELNSDDIPLRLEKLRILMIGRSIKFDPDVHDTKDLDWVVWNRGNICDRDELTLYENISSRGNNLGKLKMSWDDFKNLYRRMGYISHVYRDSDKPNRHDHCNSNPYIPLEYRDL